MFRKTRFFHAMALLTIPALATAAAGESPYARINAAAAADPVTVQALRGGVSMLSGSGGNIGVLAGPNGLFLVDAGIAVSRTKIETALRTLGKGPVRFVVNTHWHWDHTDGNAWLRAAGATIIADQHTRRHLTETIRVVEWEHTFTPIPRQSLPNRVLTKDETITFAGDTILMRHYRPSHTDGDISVYFKKANVLQTGDTFWNGMYPFIDYVGGGGIAGTINAAEANIEAAKPDTLIIPGHGPVGDRAQLIAFRDMLVAIRNKIAALKSRGQSESEVVAARPTLDFDGKWGQALISGELFTRLVYRGA